MITSEPADFITIDEAKAHLDKTTSGDDTELQRFIAGAQRKIIDLMGQVSPVTAEEDRCPNPVTGSIVLEHRPVVSVTLVEELPGGDTVPQADRMAGGDGWYLDGTEGLLRHTRSFPRLVRVTYEAGRDPAPENFHMAALDLVAHNWRRSQHNRNRPGIGDQDAVVMPGTAYALPYAVRQWLGLGEHNTDMPLAG